MSDQTLYSLVRVNQHNIALLFCNYLQTQGLIAQIQQEGDEFVIFCQQADLVFAREEFDKFIAQPNHERYQNAAWQNAQVTRVTPHTSSLLHSFKSQFLAHAGWVTLSVFVCCWLVFLGANLGWETELFYFFQFFPQLSLDYLFAEPYRLLGPALYHFSWLHIIFNTMWWWQLGGAIEHQQSKMHLVNVFLLSAIVSNLGQFFVSGANFGGLSGVVYGLVGYTWFMGWLAPEKGLSISRPILGFLLFWLLLGFTNILPVNIANTAHLLGLLSGCALAYLTVFLDKKSAKF